MKAARNSIIGASTIIAHRGDQHVEKPLGTAAQWLEVAVSRGLGISAPVEGLACESAKALEGLSAGLLYRRYDAAA